LTIAVARVIATASARPAACGLLSSLQSASVASGLNICGWCKQRIARVCVAA